MIKLFVTFKKFMFHGSHIVFRIRNIYDKTFLKPDLPTLLLFSLYLVHIRIHNLQ